MAIVQMPNERFVCHLFASISPENAQKCFNFFACTGDHQMKPSHLVPSWPTCLLILNQGEQDVP